MLDVKEMMRVWYVLGFNGGRLMCAVFHLHLHPKNIQVKRKIATLNWEFPTERKNPLNVQLSVGLAMDMPTH